MALHRVAAVADLVQDQATKVEVEGVPIALVLDAAGTIHAIGDTCSHGQISLSEGFVEDGAIECWAHGSAFDLCTGKPRNLPAFEPVPVYCPQVRDGEVFIDPSVTKEIA